MKGRLLKTGDVFILWRMKYLAAQEKIEMNGETNRNWKDFEVKLKSAAPEIIETENQTGS